MYFLIFFEARLPIWSMNYLEICLVYKFFSIFCHQFQVWTHFYQRTHSIISIFKNLLRFRLWPRIWSILVFLSWYLFYGCFKTTYILLVLGEVSYNCCLVYGVVEALCWFLTTYSTNCWGIEVYNYTCGFMCFFFKFCQFMLHLFCSSDI